MMAASAPSATSPPLCPSAAKNSAAASKGSATGHLRRWTSTQSASQAASSSPSPPRLPGLAPGALRQNAPGEGKNLRRGERGRSFASGARLGGVDRLLQRPVMRDPQNLGGGVKRR